MVEKKSGDNCGDLSLYHTDTGNVLEWGLVFSIVKHSRLLGIQYACRSLKFIFTLTKNIDTNTTTILRSFITW